VKEKIRRIFKALASHPVRIRVMSSGQVQLVDFENDNNVLITMDFHREFKLITREDKILMMNCMLDGLAKLKYHMEEN